ncbi:MAG TPA: KTSC domain-containing protein [Nitrososphaera sp.]|nr:KTSC domain-containing protein [Nitrososphaera sp.]
MERHQVQSRSIRSIGYESASSTLEVEFVSDGAYMYRNVPERLYREFLDSDSKGRFFQAHIRGKYRYGRSTDEKSDSDRTTKNTLPKGQTTLLPGEA